MLTLEWLYFLFYLSCLFSFFLYFSIFLIFFFFVLWHFYSTCVLFPFTVIFFPFRPIFLVLGLSLIFIGKHFFFHLWALSFFVSQWILFAFSAGLFIYLFLDWPDFDLVFCFCFFFFLLVPFRLSYSLYFFSFFLLGRVSLALFCFCRPCLFCFVLICFLLARPALTSFYGPFSTWAFVFDSLLFLFGPARFEWILYFFLTDPFLHGPFPFSFYLMDFWFFFIYIGHLFFFNCIIFCLFYATFFLT